MPSLYISTLGKRRENVLSKKSLMKLWWQETTRYKYFNHCTFIKTFYYNSILSTFVLFHAKYVDYTNLKCVFVHVLNEISWIFGIFLCEFSVNRKIKISDWKWFSTSCDFNTFRRVSLPGSVVWSQNKWICSLQSRDRDACRDQRSWWQNYPEQGTVPELVVVDKHDCLFSISNGVTFNMWINC